MIFGKNKKRVFLDYASTTPVAEEVLGVMKKYQNMFANPSALYEEAREVKELLVTARKQIADFFGAQPKEIIFTSGGTEGNNMAILGVFEQAKRDGVSIPHIITSTIEHPSVLEVCREIARRGGEVTYIPVSSEGLVSAKDVMGAIKENTVLVSIMHANNEIGTIQPIREIGKEIKKYRHEKYKDRGNLGRLTEYPFVHTDACQSVLYEQINVQSIPVDLLTCDGIKMYGPRGVGVLYVRSGVDLRQIFFGGGQEKGLRSGTENVSAIVGLAKAFETAKNKREFEKTRLSEIRDFGIAEILKNFPEAYLNGSMKERLPNNINICFPDTDSEFLVVALDVEGIAVSYSSSCRTLHEDSSSYVIEALYNQVVSRASRGDKKKCSTSSLRITLGRDSTKKDIHSLVTALRKVILLV